MVRGSGRIFVGGGIWHRWWFSSKYIIDKYEISKNQ